MRAAPTQPALRQAQSYLIPLSTTLLPSHWWRLPLVDVARLAPVETLDWGLAKAFGLEIAIKREDLLHPQVGGNKFYKLAGHLLRFQRSGARRLLSFGGAFSNHLYALAAASHDLGVPSIGIIRGERPAQLSPTLRDAQEQGMELVFVSREEYRHKNDPLWLQALQQRFPDAYVIPEGAGDIAGSEGCMTWAAAASAALSQRPEVICLASGTGGTAAGVLAAGVCDQVCGFLALKGSAGEIIAMKNGIVAQACALAGKEAAQLPSFLLETNYSCGGYARLPLELSRFMTEFEAETGVPLDPVYTAKLLWGIAHKARAGDWRPGPRILVLHSGGLQGRRGYPAL